MWPHASLSHVGSQIVNAESPVIRETKPQLEKRIGNGWDRELSLHLDHLLVAEEALATETAHKEVA